MSTLISLSDILRGQRSNNGYNINPRNFRDLAKITVLAFLLSFLLFFHHKTRISCPHALTDFDQTSPGWLQLCPHMSYKFELRLTFDLNIGIKNVILLSIFTQSWHFAWQATFHSSSIMLWPISTKLDHKHHWPCSHLSSEFELNLTIDQMAEVKNVI